MRLHDGDDGARIGLARRLQRGRDLEGIVRVIVDDGGAVPLAHAREAALDAAEATQALLMVSRRNAELARHRDRGQRILHIVLARHGQAHVFELFRRALAAVDEHDIEMRRAFGKIDIDGADVGLGLKP